ncbi:MAG: 3-oxoacyl-[acyl-carrier-protein] reductase FabG [Fimbriimonadaceae bacterium]|nr:3-oxoacyl-[acyl-carrier-protein] reductase FabG [Fimbriimonadaceae bacterium]
MRFQDQVVVVTGASRGIGKTIAAAFAAEGAKVACVASTPENAARAASELGGGAAGFGCDIGDPLQVSAAAEAIESQMGSPSVLVNNAGMTRDGLMMRMKDEDWDAVLRVNLGGAFHWTKALIRGMMKARYGRILNMTSVIGTGGGAGQANYAAAKAGIIGLTKSTAKELGSRGITCNAIAPGFIETDMTHDLPEEMRDRIIATAPAGRLGTPEDIAPAVLFLCSLDAGYITGQVLTIDGGLTV